MIDNIEMQMVTKLISNASPEQMAVIENLIKSRKVNVTTTEGPQKTGPIMVGDKVIFLGRKTKPPVIGTVKSLNKKTVTIVDCSDGGPGWRMPATLLRHYAPGVKPIPH